jgi:RHS repeat-associated protein
LALINVYGSPRFTKTILDGLGRAITVQSGTASGCSGNGTNCQNFTVLSQVDTVYGSCACSPAGKMMQQSLPHALNATPAWTTYTYDGIGRTASVLAPDGASTTTYLYQGNTVKVTDPAGKWKTFTMDAFGHLTQVVEPNPAGGANYITTYSYDAWDNLSQVSMPRPSGTQTRNFVYNGKLLTSATNPENGTVSYTYNGYNKVATKVDAKGQAVKYSYDSIARLTQVQRYPTGQSGAEDTCQQENYYYDSSYNSSYSNYMLGRLSAVQYYGGFSPCTTTFTETYGYSQAGQKTNKGLVVTRASSTVADLESVYAYDAEGRMTSIQYPGGGPNYSYGYDTMGRLNTMTNVGSSYAMVTGTTFDPANRMLTVTGNVLNETREYNTIGQLKHLVSSAVSGSSLNITYNYSSTQNNGKITSQTDNLSGEQVVYAYDALNRLSSAITASNSWGQIYGFDEYGNLDSMNIAPGTGTSFATFSVVYNASTNRQVGECADANGNINSASLCGSSGYRYDVENRLQPPSSSGIGSFYSYAPGNKRVWRGTVNSSSTITLDEITFWSVSGQKLATYSLLGGGATLATANAYFGTRLIANNAGNVATDRLGSVGKYYPWGQVKPTGNVVGTEGFTSKERDSETGLDYFGVRYMSSAQGRFTSPDPLLSSGRPWEPQSWNRYAYTLNNPLKYIDPNGLYEWSQKCGDNDQECQVNRQQFRDALATIKTAAGKLDEGSDERNKLQGVLDKYGDEGEKNKVFIKFGAAGGFPADESTSLFGGRSTITFDMKMINNMFNTNESINPDYKASTGWGEIVAHEGAHMLDKFMFGNPVNRNGALRTEVNAFDTQSFVPKALNLQSQWGLWNPGWKEADRETMRKAAVQSEAQRDVDLNWGKKK